MSFLSFLGLVLLYCVLSRLILTTGLTLVKTPPGILDLFYHSSFSEPEYLEDNLRNTLLLPLLGEITLLFSVYVMLIYYPSRILNKNLVKIRNGIEEKKRLSIERAKLIKEYQLDEKDIPRFIKNNESLKDYLRVYKQQTSQLKI